MIGDSFASRGGEGFFGFGGRHNSPRPARQHLLQLRRRGERRRADRAGGGRNGRSALSERPCLPPTTRSPQFISSRRYGFLRRPAAAGSLPARRPTAERLERHRLRARGSATWWLRARARGQFVRSPSITGRQHVPPRWGLGPMLDRLVKNFGETEADYQAQRPGRPRQHRALPPAAEGLPDRGLGLPRRQRRLGFLHTYTSPSRAGPGDQDPAVSRNSPARLSASLDGSRTRRRSPTAGSPRNADGSPYFTTGTSGQRIALLDFTNPAAVRFWQREVRARRSTSGPTGSCRTSARRFSSGCASTTAQTGLKMHNRYLVALRQGHAPGDRALPAEAPEAPPLVLHPRRLHGQARARPPSRAPTSPATRPPTGPASSGLASSTPDMLNRAIGGAFGFGTDIGGYFDLTTPPTTKELFIRWAEWAALSPVFRLHGAGPTGTHTPWSFDDADGRGSTTGSRSST